MLNNDRKLALLFSIISLTLLILFGHSSPILSGVEYTFPLREGEYVKKYNRPVITRTFHDYRVNGRVVIKASQHWDILVTEGKDILAIANGVVSKTGVDSTAGGYIVLTTDSGLRVVVAHLSNWGVVEGDQVVMGQVIGKTGNTGHSDGPHLHIMIRDAKGKPICMNKLMDVKVHVRVE